MRPLRLLAGCVLVLGCSGSAADDGSQGGTATGGNATDGGSSNQGGAHAGASNTGEAGRAGMATAGGVSGGGRNGGGGANGAGGTTSSAGTNGKAGAAGMTGSGGSAGTGANPNDPYGDARIRCVDRTNALRATKGLAPIPRLAKAEPCVDGQAKTDSETGKAHSAFNACLDQVKWKGAGQNECPGYGSVEATLKGCLDMMWAEGPGGGHYDNMVGDSTHTACGIYTTPAGKVWLVQDFWTE